MNERRKTSPEVTAKSAKGGSKPVSKLRKKRKIRTGKPVCAVVLGMQCSGLSALSGTLGLLGCDPPKTSVPTGDTAKGDHPQSQAINDLHDDLLASAAARREDWSPVPGSWFQGSQSKAFRERAVDLLRREYGTSRLFVLDDPRICRLLPFWDGVWAEAGVEPRFVMMHRNPLEVAASLEVRDAIDPSTGLLTWLHHVLEAEAGTRGRPRTFVSYSGLIGNWPLAMERIRKELALPLARPSPEEISEVEEFLSPDLRHFDLKKPGRSNWTGEIHSILERWAKTGEDAGDHARFDAIRQLLHDATLSFADIVRNGRDRTAVQETALEASETDRADLNRKLTARDDELSIATRAAAGFEELAGSLELKVREREADLTTIEQEVEDQKKALQAVRDELAQTQSALRQRSLEAEETATALSDAQDGLTRYKASTLELEKEILEQKKRMAGLSDDLLRFRETSHGEQLRRFEEIAYLTQKILDQETKSQDDLLAVKARIAERDAAFKARQEAVETGKRAFEELTRRNAELLSRLGNSDLLAGKVPNILRAIVESNAVTRWPLRRLKERRKVLLLKELGLFDAEWYREINTDVRDSGSDPSLHFIRHGYAEGRAATPEMEAMKEGRSDPVPGDE